MSDTVIIAHPNPDTAKTLVVQVAAVSDELLIFEVDATEEVQLLCEEYGCALLLIDASLCPQNFSVASLPADAEILLLVEAEKLEESLKNRPLRIRNCSILISPAPTSLLQYNVQLLLQQRATSRELLLARKSISELTDELIRSRQAQQTQQRYLDILSERDGLTGLYNRKHLATTLRHEFQRAKRYQTDLSLLLLDIDNFKETNQNHGHLFGDFILNEIAARLTNNTRDSDLCYRFGGGNFVIILPQTSISHGHLVGEKLNKCCSAEAFDNGNNRQQVTISIGLASLCDSLPESPDQLINMADRAMYRAKAEGRDRCHIYHNEEDREQLQT